MVDDPRPCGAGAGWGNASSGGGASQLAAAGREQRVAASGGTWSPAKAPSGSFAGGG